MNNQNQVSNPERAPRPPWWQTRTAQYFIGIGIGALPLILGIVVFSNLNQNWSSSLLIASGVLYILTSIAAIVCLTTSRVRFVGYGLLTMILGLPVVAFISCIVLVTRPG